MHFNARLACHTDRKTPKGRKDESVPGSGHPPSDFLKGRLQRQNRCQADSGLVACIAIPCGCKSSSHSGKMSTAVSHKYQSICTRASYHKTSRPIPNPWYCVGEEKCPARAFTAALLRIFQASSHVDHSLASPDVFDGLNFL